MSKTVTLRLDEPVYRLFGEVAERENRPISNFIETAVMRFVREHETVDEFEMAESEGRPIPSQALVKPLISKNVHLQGGSLELHGDGETLITLDRTPPIGSRRVVWIMLGGGCFDARARFFSESRFFGSNERDYAYSGTTNRIDVIPCRPR